VPPTLTDSKSNTWTPLTDYNNPGGAASERIYYCYAPTTDAAHTFRITAGGDSFYGNLCVAAFSGAVASPFDGQNGTYTTTAPTTVNSGSITPTQTGDLIITGMSNTGSVTGVGVNSPFTLLTPVVPYHGTSPVYNAGAMAYYFDSNVSPISADWNWSGSNAGVAIAAFKGTPTVTQTGDALGTFGPLRAEGIGVMTVGHSAIGIGTFGPLRADGSGFMSQAAVGMGTFGPLRASGTMTMAVAAIKIAGVTGGGSNTFTTAPINTTGANFLVAVISQYADSDKATLSDFYGNVWTPLPAQQDSAAISYERMWFVGNAAVGPTHTFTLTEGPGGAFYGSVAVAAFSGIANVPLDQSIGSNQALGTSLSSGSMTPAQSNELLVTGISVGSADLSIGSGFTLSDFRAYNAGAGSAGVGLAYQIQSAATVANATWSWTTTQRSSTTLAAFKTTAAQIQSGTAVGTFGPLRAVGVGSMNVTNNFVNGVGTFGPLRASGSATQVGFTLIAHTIKSATNTATTVTLDTTGANLIVIAVCAYNGASKPSLIDFYGNVYTPLASYSSSVPYVRLYYKANPVVGSAHTFTLNESVDGAFYGALAVQAFAGADATPFDQQNGAGSDTPGTTQSSGNITPTQNGELIITAICGADGSSNYTIGGGFNRTDALDWNTGGANNEGLAMAYLAPATTSAINATWSWTGSAKSAVAVVSFKGAVTNNIITGVGTFGPLRADAAGGMIPVGSGIGTFGPLRAAGLGAANASTNTAVGVGTFGPLRAAGTGGNPQNMIGLGTFGPMHAQGSGYQSASGVATWVINTTTNGYVVKNHNTLVIKGNLVATPPPDPGNPVSVKITYNGVDYNFTETGGTDLGDYNDPDGAFTMKCIKAINVNNLPNVTVFIRPDVGTSRLEVVFELAACFRPSERINMTAYTAVIFRGATQITTFNIPRHFFWSRWRYQSSPRPVRKTLAQLVAAKLLPNYSLSAMKGVFPLPNLGVARNYTPMGFAGLLPDWGTGGGDADIGPINAHNAYYLLTGNDLNSTLALAEAAGSVPWIFRDENTNAPLDTNIYIHATQYDMTPPGDPYLRPNPATEPFCSPDVPHSMPLSYVPFLLTGDPYYLEHLQFQGIFDITFDPWNTRSSYHVFDAIRATAWGLRNAMNALVCTPASTPSWLLPKSFFQTRVDGFRGWFMGRVNDTTSVNAPGRQTFRTIESQFGDNDEQPPEYLIKLWGGTYTQTYMENYVGVMLGWADMYFAATQPEWRTIMTWKLPNPINRTNGTSGWVRAYAGPYRQVLKHLPSDPWAADWGTSWTLTNNVFGFTVGDPNVLINNNANYNNFIRNDLYFGKLAGVAGAAASFDWIDSELTRLISGGGAPMGWQWAVA